MIVESFIVSLTVGGRNDSSKYSLLAARFVEDLKLDGKKAKAVDTYVAAVRQLARFFRASPDQLSEQQVRQFLLKRKEELNLTSMRPDAPSCCMKQY